MPDRKMSTGYNLLNVDTGPLNIRLDLQFSWFVCLYRNTQKNLRVFVFVDFKFKFCCEFRS